MSPAPVKLRPDNFTPPSRTPWGGHHIRRTIKRGLDVGPSDAVVGESWEVSVEPSFPSLTQHGQPLAELIARDPEEWLGPGRGEQTSLLVKLLDAADNLSVQVHPADGDPALARDESGKPEAWIVLRADPGAGLYLGFRDGVGRSQVEECIRSGGALDQLMTFVPVAPGDAFVIAAGTPHAIGAGVTLLEPQIVRPAKRGITYRFWDWNRRYDGRGRLDAGGSPRSLHLERSLEVSSWSGPRGADFVRGCRAAGHGLGATPLTCERAVDWDWLAVDAWRGSGELALPAAGELLAVTCVHGRIEARSATGDLLLTAGESGVLPARSGPLELRGAEALCFAVQSCA